MIPHNAPTLGREEQLAASRVLGSGWVAQGPEVAAFENELCRFLDLPSGHAVAVSSGSAALFLALWALNGKCKRVGLPVYSCSALRNAVGLAGGESVYLDCEKNSVNVEMPAATRSDIDILIAPSMFGIPIEVPNRRNYLIVEDLAQALGARIAGRRIGLRGEMGICSFYATKLITTGGQGGAVISRDKALVEKVRDYREFDGCDDPQLRFNFQMTDLQAAVGRVQLGRLPDFIERREKWFAVYQAAGLDIVDGRTPSVEPVRYRIAMRCTRPPRVIAALASADIRAIVPIEKRELLDDATRYPVALTWANTMVSLPAHPGLLEEEIVHIARVAKLAS